MNITKQISLSLLLLTSGVIFASAEQNDQNKINYTRLHDHQIDICNIRGEKTHIAIALEGNTGAEIEQKYKDAKGLSAQDTAEIFPEGSKRLVSGYVYKLEELQRLMLPRNYFFVSIKKDE